MIEKIVLKYVNEGLHIGLTDVRHAYLLSPRFMPLLAEVYKGNLVYRMKGSAKRVSYRQVKRGLRKKNMTIEQVVPGWLKP